MRCSDLYKNLQIDTYGLFECEYYTDVGTVDLYDSTIIFRQLESNTGHPRSTYSQFDGDLGVSKPTFTIYDLFNVDVKKVLAFLDRHKVRTLNVSCRWDSLDLGFQTITDDTIEREIKIFFIKVFVSHLEMHGRNDISL